MHKLTISKYVLLFIILILSCNIQASSTIIEEEIIFQNGKIKFYGTLFIPEANGKLPVIVIAHGAGEEHRKLPGMRSIAQKYASTGYITLLFDRRGVGDSGGEFIETPDFVVAAGDLIAAVNFMKDRNDVDQNKIGLYGHSQAGWTMPLAAIACEDVSFMIVSSGGGMSPLQQAIYIHYTVKQLGRNAPKEEIEDLSNYVTALETYLATKRGHDEMVKLYEQSKDKSWFKMLEKPFEKQRPPAPDKLNHPDWLFFKKVIYDPELTLVSLKIPVLVLLGGKDKQVPSLLAREAWESSFVKSGQQDNLKIVWLPNETHALFEFKNGQPQMREAFSKPILEWLNSMKY